MSFASGLVGAFQDSDGGGGRHGSSPPNSGRVDTIDAGDRRRSAGAPVSAS
jgi:hypothetical protein